MNNDLQFEGKNYISSKRAAQSYGYTQDYIGQLTRSKKIEARMVGRVWYVSEESLQNYKKLADALAREKAGIQSGQLTEIMSATATPTVEVPVEVQPLPQFHYSADERSLLPEFTKKADVQDQVESTIESTPVNTPRLTSPFTSGLRNKLVAGMISVSVIAGTVLVGNMSSVKETYQALNNSFNALTERVPQSNLAAVGEASLPEFFVSEPLLNKPGFFSSIVRGFYNAIASLFVSDSEVATTVDTGSDTTSDIVTAPIVTSPTSEEPVLLSGNIVSESKALVQPTSTPIVSNYITNTTVVGMSARDVALAMDEVRLNLQSQLNTLDRASRISVRNVQNAQERDVTSKISLSTITQSTIKDSNLTNASITGSSISNSSVAATSLSANSADLISLLFGTASGTNAFIVNGTTTNATSTNLFSDLLTVSGTISLQSSTPLVTSNKLYANGTDLYWAGNVIGGATTGNWSTDGTHAWRATGNVGVGTSSPYGLLSVEQGTENVSFVVGNTGSTTVYGGASPSISINGVNGNGRVGIGTAAPNARLEIYNTSPASGVNEVLRLSNGFVSGALNEAQLKFDNGLGTHDWSIGARPVGPGYFRISQSGSEYLRIDASGKFGISSSTPWAKFSIVNYNGGTSPLFAVASSTGSGATSTVFMIESSGNVGIGTVSPTRSLDSTGMIQAIGGFSSGSVVEKSWTVDFAGVANEKVDIFFPVSNRIVGSFDITIAGGFNTIYSAGGYTKEFGVLGQNNGALTLMKAQVTRDLGETSNFFSIGDFRWDATALRWRVTVSKLSGGAQTISIHYKAYPGDAYQERMKNADITSIYTTDTTVFPSEGLSLNGRTNLNLQSAGGNVGIGTTSPYAKLSVAGDILGNNIIGSYFTATSSTATSTIAGFLDVLGTGTNATSTFSSNLWVKGTLRTGTGSIYLNDTSINAGNNGFSINTTGNSYVNAVNGNFGIGLSSPNYKLEVNGIASTTQLQLPVATSASVGGIYMGGTRVMHTLTATSNFFAGVSSGNLTMSGTENSGFGSLALNALTSGGSNVAVGYQTLNAMQSGGQNTAVGVQAGAAYTGSNSTFVGYRAGNNTTGAENTLVGTHALTSNTTGASNAVLGTRAMYLNITGTGNTAIGTEAMYYNASATSTVAIGMNAALGTSGYYNQGGVYIGHSSGRLLQANSDYNTFLGYQSGYNVSTGANNILIGATPTSGNANLTTGSKNIIIGYNISATSSTATNSLNIGNLIYGIGLDGAGTTLSTGNVGIGTTSPFAKLSVFGDTYVGGNLSATGTIQLDNNQYLKGLTSNGSGAFNIAGYNTNNDLVIGHSQMQPIIAADSSFKIFQGLFTIGNGPADSFANAGIALNVHDGKGITFSRNGSSGASGYSGVVGKITFLTPTSGFGTAPFVLQSVNSGGSFVDSIVMLDDRVGIASTSPWGKLSIANYGGSNPLFVIASSSAAIATTTQFIVDRTGNVGVGTTSPASLFTVVGGGACFSGSGATVACGNTAGNLYYRTANTGTYDVAENYMTSDLSVVAGDIVALDTTASSTITKAVLGSRVIGVVSTDPGLLLGGADGNNNGSTTRPVALSGRVPVKVNGENGNIVIGDKIALSSTAGVGRKAKGSEEVVGTALEAWSGGVSDTGTVMVFVSTKQHFDDDKFSIDQNGNIGIGTTTPGYKLQVMGDIAATSFVNISTRDAKHDISYLGGAEKVSILNRIKTIGIAQYRYNTESDLAPLRLGLIAEEAPVEILAAGGKGVDVYKLSTFILAGVQEMQATIEKMNLSVEDLKGRMTTVEGRLASLELFAETGGLAAVSASSTASTTIDTVSSYLASAGIAIDAVASKIMAIVTDTLTANFVVINNTLTVQTVNAESISSSQLRVGTSTNPAAAGITILDRATGQPYCMFVSNGLMQGQPGECATPIIPPVVPVENGSGSGNGTGGVTGGDTGTTTSGSGDTGTTTPDSSGTGDVVSGDTGTVGDTTGTTTTDGSGSTGGGEVVPEATPTPEPTPEPVPEVVPEPTPAPEPVPEPTPEAPAETPAP